MEEFQEKVIPSPTSRCCIILNMVSHPVFSEQLSRKMCHLSKTQGSYRLQSLQDQADIWFLPSVFQENQSVAFTTGKV